MESSFQRGLQGYVFGGRPPSTVIQEEDLERSVSPRFQGHRPSSVASRPGPGNRLASVALPRLEKGAVQHEMIVAYLYQQQRQRFWISDDPFTEEGAFMRETWSEFITAPAHLAQSPLAEALVALNAEVSFTSWIGWSTSANCYSLIDRDYYEVQYHRSILQTEERYRKGLSTVWSPDSDDPVHSRSEAGSQASVCNVCSRRIIRSRLGQRPE